MSLRAYYPEPIAAFDHLRILPEETAPTLGGQCESAEHGSLAYDGARHLYMCLPDSAGSDQLFWAFLPNSPWAYNLTRTRRSYTPHRGIMSPADADDPDLRVWVHSPNSALTDPPEFRLTIQDNGGLLGIGLLHPGSNKAPQNYNVLPESGYSGIAHGAGTRLIWYPEKSAFLAGHLDETCADCWNDSHIPHYTVLLGHNPSTEAEHSGLLSGQDNSISPSQSVYTSIAGGLDNTIKKRQRRIIFLNYYSTYAVIGGGHQNAVQGAEYAFIGGGSGNSTGTRNALIIGGKSSWTKYARYSVIGGGESNSINDTTLDVANLGFYGYVIFGGQNNEISGTGVSNFIGGGSHNEHDSSTYNTYSTILGGTYNVTHNSNRAIIAGGSHNLIENSTAAMIGSGGGSSTTRNIIRQSYGVILGGENNLLNSSDCAGASRRAVIAGGKDNAANNDFSSCTNATSVFIGGGLGHYTKGGFIAGGHNNTSYPYQAGIGAGEDNIIGSSGSATRGWGSYIPAGKNVTVTAQGSWASGRHAVLHTNYSFLWAHGADSSNPVTVGSTLVPSAPPVFIIMSDYVGIQTTTPQYRLDVNGDAVIRGSLSLSAVAPTSALSDMDPFWITRLKINTTTGTIGLDLAEFFMAQETLAPGTVAAMDPESGRLIPASGPYNTKTIGIVSSMPGMIFEGNRTVINPSAEDLNSRSTDRRAAVALKGRVPVKVCLENGPIQPGDPLTSSSVAGHAMRSSDPELSWGTTIGKALEGFDGGPNGETTGEITAFVTLY